MIKVDPAEIRQIAIELGMIKIKERPAITDLLENLYRRQHRARSKFRIKRGPHGRRAKRRIR